MESITTKLDSLQAVQLFDDWFDPIETEVRGRVHKFIEELILASNWTPRWPARATGERRPSAALMVLLGLRATGTAAGRGR